MSSLSIGIVGLPNVGKSTLFNALLKQQAALAANYPFATIEPNVGVVPVPDARLTELARVIAESEKLQSPPPIKPATIEFVDIAGLVKGASQGEGLGNKFLAHIRETAMIAHVVRAFEDGDIIREGSTDPLSDLETIRTELQLADLATLSKQPQPKGAVDKEAQQKWDILQEFIAIINEGKPVHTSPRLQKTASGDPDELAVLVAKELCLLTAKAELFVVNVSEDQLTESTYTDLVEKFAAQLNVSTQAVIVVSAKIESELSSLAEEDQTLYLADLGMESSGLERLIQRAYQVLGLQSFLTAGEVEVRAWTVKSGTSAPHAAGVIHTDFAKKFIKAIVCDYTDFISLGGWKAARDQGKIRQEGKEYIMRPDDVVEFMIGK
jgi:ribosome-binding ATPase